MYVKDITLENFGHFKKLHLEFTDGINVIIANNGKGKSTILDALSVVLGSWFLGIKGIDSRNIRDNEVRKSLYDFKKENYPVAVHSNCVINNQKISLTRERLSTEGGTTRNKSKRIMQEAEFYFKNRLELPLVAYYGTGRRWLEPKDKKTNKMINIFNNQEEGYRYSIDPRVNIKFFTDWFMFNVNEPHAILIKNVLKNCIEGCIDIAWDNHIDMLIIKFENNKSVPFSFLSDGQKTLLAMIADIAFKIITLNSRHINNYNNFFLEAKGCILIDEIDLHLHPKWQRDVLNNLAKAFPKLQFIVTTHSPFIIQSIEEGNLIRLNEKEEKEFRNLSIEEISEELMGIELPQRSKKFVNMFNCATNYYRKLDEIEKIKHNDSLDIEKIMESVESLDEELDELLIPYSDDPAHAAYLAYLKTEKLSRNL